MEDLGNLFERLKENDLLNTSYPLRVKDWDAFRVHESLSFDDERELAFYIHIPFCKQLCSFCEYCRMPLPSAEIQEEYLRTIKSDINKFISKHKHINLYGFDIGGGTPTSLDESCFQLLMDIYDNTANRQSWTVDFEPSIEATFQTLTIDKIRRIAQIQRTAHKVSHGLQVLGLHHRLYPAVRQQRLHQPCRMAIIGKPASHAVAPQFGKHLVTGVNVCVGNHPMHLGQKFQVNICTPIKAVHIPAQSPRP